MGGHHVTTGRELGKAISDAARFAGWRHVHWRPAHTAQGWRSPFTGDRGFPDYVIARAGETLALELKGDGDPIRDGQLEWLLELGGPTGGTTTAGIVTGRELDLVLAYLVGRAGADDLRLGLETRWFHATGAP
jgi:hypothetical protein